MSSKILNYSTPIIQLKKAFSKSRLFTAIPLRIFRSIVFIRNPDRNTSKLDQRDRKCVFVGIALNKKGYKCFDHITKRLFVTMDDLFF